MKIFRLRFKREENDFAIDGAEDTNLLLIILTYFFYFVQHYFRNLV